MCTERQEERNEKLYEDAEKGDLRSVDTLLRGGQCLMATHAAPITEKNKVDVHDPAVPWARFINLTMTCILQAPGLTLSKATTDSQP